MSKTPWYDSDNPGTVARGAAWRVAVWVIAALVFIGLIGAAIWGIKVATSDIKGQGDAIRNKNDGVNRVVKQELFEAMYADIKADDDKVQTMWDAYKRNKSYTNEVNLNGVIANCQTSVQDYNAEARKFSSADFRSADLPYQIDDLDPSTDCKPDNK